MLGLKNYMNKHFNENSGFYRSRIYFDYPGSIITIKPELTLFVNAQHEATDQCLDILQMFYDAYNGKVDGVQIAPLKVDATFKTPVQSWNYAPNLPTHVQTMEKESKQLYRILRANMVSEESEISLTVREDEDFAKQTALNKDEVMKGLLTSEELSASFSDVAHLLASRKLKFSLTIALGDFIAYEWLDYTSDTWKFYERYIRHLSPNIASLQIRFTNDFWDETTGIGLIEPILSQELQKYSECDMKMVQGDFMLEYRKIIHIAEI